MVGWHTGEDLPGASGSNPNSGRQGTAKVTIMGRKGRIVLLL